MDAIYRWAPKMDAIYKWDFPRQKETFRARLVKAILEEFAITHQELIGNRSYRLLTDARKIYVYLCRTHLHDTFMRMGMDLGGRDHSTCHNLLQRMQDHVFVKDPVAQNLKAIEAKILNQSINN